jgi:hypothetical protein
MLPLHSNRVSINRYVQADSNDGFILIITTEGRQAAKARSPTPSIGYIIMCVRTGEAVQFNFHMRSSPVSAVLGERCPGGEVPPWEDTNEVYVGV